MASRLRNNSDSAVTERLLPRSSTLESDEEKDDRIEEGALLQTGERSPLLRSASDTHYYGRKSLTDTVIPNISLNASSTENAPIVANVKNAPSALTTTSNVNNNNKKATIVAAAAAATNTAAAAANTAAAAAPTTSIAAGATNNTAPKVAASSSGVDLVAQQKRKIVAKQSRPRRAISEFRKKKVRDTVDSNNDAIHLATRWTGRVGAHVHVDEIDIAKLIQCILPGLPGGKWEASDMYDVMRVWQVEMPFINYNTGGNNDFNDEGNIYSPNNYIDYPLSDEESWKDAYYTSQYYNGNSNVYNNNIMNYDTNFDGDGNKFPLHGYNENAFPQMYDYSAARPEIFIFSFGAIVMWNFANQAQEADFIKKYILCHKDAVGVVHPADAVEGAQDDMSFQYLAGSNNNVMNMNRNQGNDTNNDSNNPADINSSNSKKFSIKRDIAYLATRESGERLAVSFALAKSSLLSIYEWQVQRTIERNSHIPEEMAKNGRLYMHQRDITREVGKMFLVKHGINLDCSLIDTPEEFWEDDRFEFVYDMALKYFEISKRLTLVNNRLTMIGELHQVLIEETQNYHAVMLEWIIILLIIVEVVLDLMHLGFY